HEVARLTQDGVIAERHRLLFPQVQMYGVADRLVYLGLPIVPGRPVLAVSDRRHPEDVRPWPGLLGRSVAAPAPALASNIVGCGIGSGTRMPCWFLDRPEASISDGVTARSIALPWLLRPDVDQSAPIRDVALVPDGSLWVLAAATAAPQGRRVGGLLARTDAAGRVQRSIALSPEARLIMSADATHCVLLTIDGGLLRVWAAGS